MKYLSKQFFLFTLIANAALLADPLRLNYHSSIVQTIQLLGVALFLSVGTPHIDLFRSPFPISVAASHHPSPLWHRIFSLSFLLNFSIVAAPVTVFSLPFLSVASDAIIFPSSLGSADLQARYTMYGTFYQVL